jgi:tRNA A37 threonylcarbamoyladenosine synthetase subunit TsaC/SUA5/YrdC
MDPARTVSEAMSYFSDKLKIFLDGGRLKGVKGSTVVVIMQDKLKVIREGEISLQELKKALAAED